MGGKRFRCLSQIWMTYLLVTWCVAQPIITDQAPVISAPRTSVSKASPVAQSVVSSNDAVPDLATKLTDISMDYFSKVLDVVMKIATEAGISGLSGAVAAGTNATIELGNAGSKVAAQAAKQAENAMKERSTDLVDKAVDGVTRVKEIASDAATSLLDALSKAVGTMGR